MDRAKHEGILFWTRFSAFVVIENILGYAWFWMLKSYMEFESGLFLLGVIGYAGLLLSFAWLLVSINSAYWQEHFNVKARAYERRHLNKLPQAYDRAANSRKVVWFPDLVFVGIALASLTTIAWVAIILNSPLAKSMGSKIAITLSSFYIASTLIENLFSRLKCWPSAPN